MLGSTQSTLTVRTLHPNYSFKRRYNLLKEWNDVDAESDFH